MAASLNPRSSLLYRYGYKAHIVTLLREPRDQVISSYLYVRFDRGVPDHGRSRALGFREFVLAPALCEFSDNLATPWDRPAAGP